MVVKFSNKIISAFNIENTSIETNDLHAKEFIELIEATESLMSPYHN